METDADRLAMIKSLGGESVASDAGSFFGIFDRNYQAVTLGSIDVEDRAPAITCRTSDVERLQLTKDTALTVSTQTFRVKRLEPDGTGITVVVLRS